MLVAFSWTLIKDMFQIRGAFLDLLYMREAFFALFCNNIESLGFHNLVVD